MMIVRADSGVSPADVDQGVEKIAEVFREMEFNEAWYRRNYVVSSSGPIRDLFDGESVHVAARRVLEDCRGNWRAIQGDGYKAVIREVFLLKNCIENEVARAPSLPRPLPEASWPLTLWKKEKRKPAAALTSKLKRLTVLPALEYGSESQDGVWKTTDNFKSSAAGDETADGPPEPDIDDVGYIASTSGPQNEDLDPELPPGFEDFQKSEKLEEQPPLLPPPVPAREAYDWKVSVDEFGTSGMTELLLSRLEIAPALGELAILETGVFKFVSGVVAELFYEACASSPPIVEGKELSFERLYSPMEVFFLDFLVRRHGTSSTTIIYFRGDRKGWTETLLQQLFSEVVPEQDVGELIRSVHLFPEALDALVELGSDVIADLLFYRWGRNRRLEYICRIKVLPESEIEPLIDVVSVLPDLNFPSLESRRDANNEGSDKEAKEQQQQRLEAQPLPGSCQADGTFEPVQQQQLEVRLLPESCQVDNAERETSKQVQEQKQKLEVRLLPETLRRCQAENAQLNQGETSKRVQQKLEVGTAGETSKSVQQQKLDVPRTFRNWQSENAEFSRDTFGFPRLRDIPAELKLVVKGDDPGIESFLNHLLCQKQRRGRCRVFCFGTLSVARCSCEDEANVIMEAYVREPEKFFLGGEPLEICRDKAYFRPGQVNKQDIVVDEYPGRILVSGLPDLPDSLLKAVLTELLDREFASNPAVREHRNRMFKMFEDNVIGFYTHATTEALLELKHPLRLGDNLLSFESCQKRVSKFSQPLPAKSQSRSPEKQAWKHKKKHNHFQREDFGYGRERYLKRPRYDRFNVGSSSDEDGELTRLVYSRSRAAQLNYHDYHDYHYRR